MELVYNQLRKVGFPLFCTDSEGLLGKLPYLQKTANIGHLFCLIYYKLALDCNLP